MPQAIVIIISFILLFFIINPIRFINFYFFSRPILAQFSFENLTLLSLPINWPLAAIVLLTTIVYVSAYRNFRLYAHNMGLIYILTIMSILSWSYSINITLSIGQTIKFVNAICISLLIINMVRTPRDGFNIFRGIEYSSIIPMLYGFYQVITNTGVKGLGGAMNRATSVFGFANLYGIFLVFVIMSSVVLIIETKGKKEAIFHYIILATSILSSIVSLNRGTWIALVASLFLTFPIYKDKLNLKLFLGVLALVVSAASTIIIDRFLDLNADRAGADTLEGREYMWEEVVNHLHEVPVLGFGTGTAMYALEMMFNEKNLPHNDYVRLFVEMGYFAPFIYILFLVKEFYYLLRVRKNQKYWHVNYIATVILIYWSIISLVQNAFHDVVVFPLFLVMLFLAKRFNEMKTPS